MDDEKKPLPEITNRPTQLPSEDIGASETIRSPKPSSIGSGDYTSERDVLFKDVTLDEILEEVKRSRRPRSDGPAPTEG